MTTKHYIIIGLVAGVAVGYFANAQLNGYPVYSQVATWATGFATG